METFSGIALTLIVLFLIVLFLLWFTLPFLIVGTNNRLNRVIALLHENNTIQEDIRAELCKLAGEAEKSLSSTK